MINIKLLNDNTNEISKLLNTSPYINSKIRLVPEGFAYDKTIVCYDVAINEVRCKDVYHLSLEKLKSDPRSEVFDIMNFCPELYRLDFSDYIIRT